jgi:hypothetical protein
MAWQGKQNQSSKKCPIYEIRLQGQIDKDWSEWLEGLTISYDRDVTILRGHVIDQSALQGILTKIWDLNRTVVSVKQIQDL